jgi:hypothetical protein
MSVLEPAAIRCLDRTRSVVLDVLVAVGAGIAVSGFVLRSHEVRVPATVGKWLLAGLVVVVVTSYAVRRVLSRRTVLDPPGSRSGRFFWAHVLSAAVAALAVPLGFLHGWLVRPRLDSIAPFWVVALACGFLALPREHELEGFDDPIPL